GDWTLTVDGVRQTDDGRNQIEISARERRGRRQSLTFDGASGLLRSATMDVFMGQGEQFALSITQTAAAPVSPASLAATEETMTEMLQLQNQLSRRPDSQVQELSARQVASGRQMIDRLSTLSADTPLAEAVFRIRRNLTRQQRRLEGTMTSRDRIVGSQTPGFQLSLIDGTQLDSASLAGHTTILHFWKYSDKPLKEPYGQVGYLEFLYNKQAASKVRVVGVATNPSLQDSAQTRQAQRSARKLQEFMNLSYPIGWDDGSLIRSLGDPRESGGELPLWVIIGPDGKVAHYSAGYYEVDRRAGLRELNEALNALK
ncbi:MAG: redoxin domain-containing protein, partial [Planctomycetaceae bacterium]|nr:redoxin domain-containing protein [Planctomycetaceae bacterium]